VLTTTTFGTFLREFSPAESGKLRNHQGMHGKASTVKLPGRTDFSTIRSMAVRSRVTMPDLVGSRSTNSYLGLGGVYPVLRPTPLA